MVSLLPSCGHASQDPRTCTPACHTDGQGNQGPSQARRCGRGPTSPPGGDPGEERTPSPRNTTASRRGRTPVCPPGEERTPTPPNRRQETGGAAHLSAPLVRRGPQRPPTAASIPRGRTPVRCCQRRQLGFPRLWLRWVLQDPLHLLRDLPGPQQPAVVVEPDLEVAAPVEDDDVLAVPQVLDGVCGGRGQVSRGTRSEDARPHDGTTSCRCVTRPR